MLLCSQQHQPSGSDSPKPENIGQIGLWRLSIKRWQLSKI
jgi:hypothetical protein